MVAMYATQTFVTSFMLAAPSGLAASANVGGGSFGAATYFWKITGINANGETTGSNEATVAVAASGTATLTWSALPAGTSGVKVYRGTVTNTENVLVATLGAVVTYTDTGIAGTAGAPPANASASLGSHCVVEGSLRDSTHPAVVATPSLFTASAPVTGKGHIDGKLGGYLAAYPSGP